jgi:hypothetical protein
MLLFMCEHPILALLAFWSLLGTVRVLVRGYAPASLAAALKDEEEE